MALWHFGDPIVGLMRPRRQLARELPVEGELHGGEVSKIWGVAWRQYLDHPHRFVHTDTL
jgi:hypothetical protein